MGIWQNALIKAGISQPGPKITAHDRAVLEWGFSQSSRVDL